LRALPIDLVLAAWSELLVRLSGSDGRDQCQSAPTAVDKVEGNRIKLTKKDSGEGSHEGHHHFIDKNLVAEVEGNKVRLSAIGAVAVTMEEEN